MNGSTQTPPEAAPARRGGRGPLLLGVDGGGSGCRARLTDAHARVLGEGLAGPANSQLGVARAFAEISAAAREALRQAGLPATELARLHAGCGLAGLHVDADRAAATAFEHPFETLVLETDVYIACLGAHLGRDGAVLVLGTGSSGCALSGGHATYVGGWGLQVSDHGSGAATGRAALRQALLAHEHVIPASPLSETLMARFEGSPQRMVRWASDAEPADYARYAPLVAEGAARGDRMACELMREAGEDASRLARALARLGAGRIALLGGFSAAVEPWMADDVRSLLVAPQGDAADGALLLARRALPRSETPA